MSVKYSVQETLYRDVQFQAKHSAIVNINPVVGARDMALADMALSPASLGLSIIMINCVSFRIGEYSRHSLAGFALMAGYIDDNTKDCVLRSLCE